MSGPARTPPPGDDEQRRAAATSRHVQQLRAFHVHAGVFAAAMVLVVLVNLATNVAAGIAGDPSAWWSAWAALGWGCGICVHGLVVRLDRTSRSSSSWVRRRVDEEPAR